MIRLKDKSVGGVYLLRFLLLKDGEDWTSVESAVISFRRPDGTYSPEVDLEHDGTNVWTYTTSQSDLDQVGYWVATVTATEGDVVVKYPDEIGFLVVSR